MAARPVHEGFREEVRREELLSSLSAVEQSLEGPRTFNDPRDISQLASALAAWIDAADTAAGVYALADEDAGAGDILSRFSAGQTDAIEEIQRLSQEADVDSPEELAHLNERAGESVGAAVRLQIRKQRYAARVRDGELGGE